MKPVADSNAVCHQAMVLPQTFINFAGVGDFMPPDNIGNYCGVTSFLSVESCLTSTNRQLFDTPDCFYNFDV